MEIVKQISAPIIELGGTLGALLIPVIIAASLLLLVFAKYSYKLFRIVLPIAGLGAGYYAGSKMLGYFVQTNLPEVAKVIDPSIAAGVACALVVALFCLRAQSLTILAIGLCVGYALIGDTVIKLLRSLDFVAEILLNVDKGTALVLAAIISLVCAVVTMAILKKFFNFVYIFTTSVGGCVLAFALPAIFIFASAAIFETAVAYAAGIGAALGLIFFIKQYNYYRFYW